MGRQRGPRHPLRRFLVVGVLPAVLGVRPRPHPLRALRLRGRRQRRGRAPRRHQRRPHQDHGVRDLLVHGGGRRPGPRLAAALGGHRRRRRLDPALLDRRGGDRRHVAVRRPRAHQERPTRGARHRLDRQRAWPARPRLGREVPDHRRRAAARGHGRLAVARGARRHRDERDGQASRSSPARAGASAPRSRVRFHGDGARVALASRSGDDLGHRGVGLECDVRDPARSSAAVDAAVAEFGRLDIVVANAGIGAVRAVPRDSTRTHVEAMIDVNLKGTLYTARVALPHLIERQGRLRGPRVRRRRCAPSRARPSTTRRSSGSSASRARSTTRCASTACAARRIAPGRHRHGLRDGRRAASAGLPPRG